MSDGNEYRNVFDIVCYTNVTFQETSKVFRKSFSQDCRLDSVDLRWLDSVDLRRLYSVDLRRLDSVDLHRLDSVDLRSLDRVL